MHVKSAWHRGALSVAMAVGMIFVGISVSPDVHAGTGLASPNCGNGSVRRPVAFRMAGNQLSVSSDPTSVCHGDSVQWDNSANRQSVQVVFDGDPFQNGGTYTVPAGQTLSCMCHKTPRREITDILCASRVVALRGRRGWTRT